MKPMVFEGYASPGLVKKLQGIHWNPITLMSGNYPGIVFGKNACLTTPADKICNVLLQVTLHEFPIMETYCVRGYCAPSTIMGVKSLDQIEFAGSRLVDRSLHELRDDEHAYRAIISMPKIDSQ